MPPAADPDAILTASGRNPAERPGTGAGERIAVRLSFRGVGDADRLVVVGSGDAAAAAPARLAEAIAQRALSAGWAAVRSGDGASLRLVGGDGAGVGWVRLVQRPGRVDIEVIPARPVWTWLLPLLGLGLGVAGAVVCVIAMPRLGWGLAAAYAAVAIGAVAGFIGGALVRTDARVERRYEALHGWWEGLPVHLGISFPTASD